MWSSIAFGKIYENCLHVFDSFVHSEHSEFQCVMFKVST